MGKETYSIPTSPVEQLEYVRNAVTMCTTNATAWGVPAAKLTAIAPLRTTYEQKSAIANNPQTQSPAATAARKSAWVALEPSIVDSGCPLMIASASIIGSLISLRSCSKFNQAFTLLSSPSISA